MLLSIAALATPLGTQVELVNAEADAATLIRHYSLESGEAFAASKFHVDRDGVQWVAPTATSAEIADHFDLCGRLSRIFNASIRLAVMVARIALFGVSGPPGWIMAAISFTALMADVVPLATDADRA